MIFPRSIILFVVVYFVTLNTFAISISGKLILPEPASASGISFDVDLYDENQVDTNGGFDSVVFSSGQTEANFTVPAGSDTGSSWILGATCTANCTEYMDYINYSSTTSGNVTVDYDLITRFPGSSTSHTDKDFQALKAVNISGEISFPSGFPAPTGGIELHTSAVDKNKPKPAFDWYEAVGSESVVVTQGSSSFAYSFKVVKNPTGEIVVDIYCPDESITTGPCSEYLDNAFYATPDTTYDFENATILDGDKNHIDIDIDLLKARTISGEVALPTGSAPAGGVDVAMQASELESPYRFGAYKDVNISESNSNAQYAMKVPANEPVVDWAVLAECMNNCGPYETDSWYSTIGSTHLGAQATRLPNTQNYTNINISLVEKYSGAAPMCDVLLDNFSGQSLDLDDWYNPEGGRVLSGGKLVSRQKMISTQKKITYFSAQRFSLDFSGLPNNYEAKVAITEADLTASGTGVVDASVGGTFYNADFENSAPDDQTGSIFASVSIGDKGAGLEAWWSIGKSLDAGFTQFVEVLNGTLIAPGTLSLNTEYVLKIVYDGSNGFTFSTNGVSNSQEGPARMSLDSAYGYRRLQARAIPEDNSDLDPISSIATFDDVMVNNVLYDDFSGTNLDPAKWNHAQASRKIDSGKLQLDVFGPNTDQRSVRADTNYSLYKDASCLQATLNMNSSSDIPSGTRGRLRIDGYWYNTEVADNGLENVVWAQLVLEKTEDETMRAVAYAERSNDADYNDATELFWHEFSTPMAFDTDYVVAIKLEKDKNRMLFRIDDEVFVYPIQTDIHPVDPDEDYNGILARVQSGPGEVHGTVDEVYITPAPIVPEGCGYYSFKATNGNSITICL